jgi:eukaryotic-like serine/threonine-protein kinase
MTEHKPSPDEILAQAVEISDLTERKAFLDRACADDESLRKEVESLLVAYVKSGSFLDAPAVDPEVTLEPDGPAEGIGESIGRYKLLEKIGEGGMAVVYMAEQKRPIRRRVALKLIKLGMDSKQVIARFEAERQALALMDHPNIAKVLDAGTTDTGRPYFVMELVRGLPMTEFCDSNHQTTQERLDLFVAVCQAVQHAHQRGIIHRDIKPSNVLVTLHDGQPVPKVIDFGIAKATNQQLTEKTVFTRYAQMIGTPEYMSPEQAEMSGLDIDTRTDVFSLGVLLYELLTGVTPFDTEYLMSKGYGELQRIIREEEPVRPSTKVSTLGQALTDVAKHRRTSPELLCKLIRTDLDWIVMKSLEKDRSRRYESVSELAADVKRHLDNEPVLAGKPSGFYRAQKFIKRNRILCVSSAAVAIILILAVIVSSHQAWNAQKARKAEGSARTTAEQERDRAKNAEQQAGIEKRTAQKTAYASKMQLARVDWENGNIARLQKTLAETEDNPNRGFEWYYWQRMCRLELMTLRVKSGEGCVATYSPDGQFIASSSGNKAHIWDTRSGVEIVTCEGHKDSISSLAYSSDGRWLVTGSQDQTARIWDVKTGRQFRLLQGHIAHINCVDFSPNGRLIATVSSDRTARVWDAISGREKCCLRGHTGRIFGVDFSPDGQRLATGSGDKTIRVWDISSKENIFMLGGHEWAVMDIDYSPDGQRLISAHKDGTITIWDVVHGKQLKTYKGHNGQVNSVSVSPDGKRIVSGSNSGTIKTWDIDGEKELLTFKGHTGPALSAVFCPDGGRIVSGSTDGTAKVWNAVDNLNALTLDHGRGVTDIRFSPDSRWLATGGWFSSHVKIWDVIDGRLRQTLSGHRFSLRSIAFSPDGQRIACGSEDGAIEVWDVSSGRILFTIDGDSDFARSVAYTPDNKRLISAGDDGVVRIWDAATGQLRRMLKGHSKGIRTMAVSPDGRYIASGGDDRSVRLWDAFTGQELHVFKGHQGAVWSLTFSPDGKRLISGEQGNVKAWDISAGREVYNFDSDNMWGRGFAFSPDGKRFAVDTLDGNLRVADSPASEEFLVLTGPGNHYGEATFDVIFSPDGQRLATSSGGSNAVRIWKTASKDEVRDWHNERLFAEEEQAKRSILIRREAERQTLIRLSDEGALKSWLVLWPISLHEGQSVTSALEEEQGVDEVHLHPREGDGLLVDGNKFAWTKEHAGGALINIGRHEQRNPKESLVYAVCYVRMPTAKKGVVMKVGSIGSARVYLNTELVYEFIGSRVVVVDEDTIAEMTLKSGINVIVFKAVVTGSRWKGSLRFMDNNGNPIEGLSVTLDPNDLIEN